MKCSYTNCLEWGYQLIVSPSIINWKCSYLRSRNSNGNWICVVVVLVAPWKRQQTLSSLQLVKRVTIVLIRRTTS